MSWLTVAELNARHETDDSSGTHKHDLIKEARIAEAIDLIESRTRRKFLAGTYSRRFDGNGRDRMPLPFGPVSSVTAVTIGQSVKTIGTAAQYHAGGGQDVWYDDSALYNAGGFARGRRNVAVTWVIGEPEDIGLAKGTAAALAWHLYKKRHRIDVSGQSNSKGSASLFDGLPAQLKAQIRQLEDVRFIDRGSA